MPVVPSVEAPAPLATAAELQVLMPAATLDVDQVEFLLAIASGTIRDHTLQTISYVEDDVLEIRGTFGREFWLPERPTLSISSISVNDDELPVTGYRWSRDGRVTFDRYAWPTVVNAPDAVLGGSWGGDERFLTIVYDHGYESVPPAVKGVCLDLARRGVVAPDAGIIRQESLGSYNVSYSAEAARTLTDADRRALRRYCRRNAMVVPVP